MAKVEKKQKSAEKKSPKIVVKLPKKVLLFILVLFAIAGLIYFGGKLFLRYQRLSRQETPAMPFRWQEPCSSRHA